MTAHGTALDLAARRTVLRHLLVPGWAVLACVLVATHAPSGVRAPVIIVLFCFVPGTALVGLFNADSIGVELSLSIALSIALSGLTAGVLVYAHAWSSTAVVVVVAAISLAGSLRDVRLGQRRRHDAPRPVRPGALLAGAWGAAAAGLPAAIILGGELAGRTARGLSGGLAAVPRLARRIEVRPRSGTAVVRFHELLRPAGRRPRVKAAVRPERPAVRRSRPERTAAPPVAVSPLQGFLLDELRQRTGSHAGGRRRRPRSFAHLEPHELADLLTWSALQRFVTQRAIKEANPELWFVDDLERRLRPQAPGSRDELPGRRPSAPRGVWITGVSARTSIPVAWRVLEDEVKPKEWRTRLALEMIDALPELGPGGAVVAAGTAYGSLAGFRRGLEERGFRYLVRVDPVTAAREIAPDRPSRSAAEARKVLRARLAVRAGAQPKAAPEEPELVAAQGTEHLLLCQVRATGRGSVFWLSNLPPETGTERLASLVRLADRSRVELAGLDLLHGALKVQAGGAADLDRELALVALAGGLRTLDLSSAKGTVDT